MDTFAEDIRAEILAHLDAMVELIRLEESEQILFEELEFFKDSIDKLYNKLDEGGYDENI